jgi:hypothetical protein
LVGWCWLVLVGVGWSVGCRKESEKKKQNLFFILPAQKSFLFFYLFFIFVFVVVMLMQLFFLMGWYFFPRTDTQRGGTGVVNVGTHNFDSWRKMKP